MRFNANADAHFRSCLDPMGRVLVRKGDRVFGRFFVYHQNIGSVSNIEEYG